MKINWWVIVSAPVSDMIRVAQSTTSWLMQVLSLREIEIASSVEIGLY